MSLLYLDDDSLLALGAHLHSTGEVLAIMRTCKRLHALLTPTLLQHVELDEVVATYNFTSYIERNPDCSRFVGSLALCGMRYRAGRVREGWIAMGSLGDGVSTEDDQPRRVSTLIQRLPRLGALKVSAVETVWFHRLVKPLISCFSLTTLAIEKGDGSPLDPTVIQSLNSLPSSLVSLSLKGISCVPITLDPLSPLTRLCSTLQSLTVEFSSALRCYGPQSIWPHLHSLTITAPMDVASVEDAFPALRTLVVFRQPNNIYHDRNIRYEANLTHQCSQWQELSRVEGDIQAVWELALSGVKVDTLKFVDAIKHRWTSSAVLDIMNRVNPTTVSLRSHRLHLPLLTGNLSRLQHFHLAIFPPNGDIGTVVDRLVSHLGIQPATGSEALPCWTELAQALQCLPALTLVDIRVPPRMQSSKREQLFSLYPHHTLTIVIASILTKQSIRFVSLSWPEAGFVYSCRTAEAREDLLHGNLEGLSRVR